MNVALRDEGIERVDSLRVQVAKRLREQLRLGKLPPGTRLTEKAVAEALGVSRTPAREALNLLGEGGVLESRPSGGYIVPVMTHTDIDELYEVRGYLEVPALKQSIKHADDELKSSLKKSFSIMSAHVGEFDNVKFLEAVLRYRELIFGACGNTHLSKTILDLDNHTESMKIKALSNIAVREGLLAFYEDLLGAICAGDASGAVKILKAHHVQGIAAYHSALIETDRD